MTGPLPRPASTVALLRPSAAGLEVLLTRRPRAMDFGPGIHVFPGGAVDPVDDAALGARSVLDAGACASAWAGDLEPHAALPHAVAAVRELYEEAGTLLAEGVGGTPVPASAVVEALASRTPLHVLAARLDLRLRTDLLVPLARWVTPPGGTTRRYDARFYAAALPEGAQVQVDEREVDGHAWLRPAAALDGGRSGSLELWPPTSATLGLLAPARDIGEVRAWLAPVVRTPPPEVEVVDEDIVRVRLGAASGIPGCTVDAWLIGRERVVVVDPGDPNDQAAEAILEVVAARGGAVAGIAVTSGAPDHVGGATGLAMRTGRPVWIGAAAAWLVGDVGKAVGEGSRITDGDIGLAVRDIAGDPDGAVAICLEDGRAVLTGDAGTRGPSRGIGWSDGGAGRELPPGIPGRRLPAHA